jgi:glyceraldehyde 3-phosphate dehydrogenase
MAKIAINGFGRIGRLFFRQALDEPSLEVAAINDLGDLNNLAYLLKHDTVYRDFPGEIKTEIKGNENYLVIDGNKIRVLQEKDPLQLPWGKLGIDIVVESTGVFESFEKAKVHLEAGAKRVVISAPAKDPEGTASGRTILVGINEKETKGAKITSNASCTTNAVALLMTILSKNPGISKAILNTAHAYTATQSLTDGPVKGKDFLRGRAGAQNLVPSTTGAALAVTRIVKDLENKFDGIAIRTPIVCGSLADVTFLSKRKTSVEEINKILKEAAADPKMKGIFAVSEEPLVSSDIIGSESAAIVDLSFTRVVDGDLVKVLAWYDNEWGYCSTLLKHVLKAAESL